MKLSSANANAFEGVVSCFRALVPDRLDDDDYYYIVYINIYDSFSELVLAPNDKFLVMILGANGSSVMSNEEAFWFMMKAVYYVY